MEFNNLQDFRKLLSCPDVAKRYKVGRGTVYLHCKNGKIKDCVKTRAGYLIDPHAVINKWPKRQPGDDEE